MAIQNGFFKSINGDRRYLAEFFTSYFASFIGNGVFPNPSTNLQVINNQNFSTIVRPGKGWINGHYLNNDDSIVINHQPPDGVLRRIDRIVFSVNLDSRSMDIYLKQGTPSSSAVAPTLIRNSTLYELALADIAFNPGMVSISQSNITDQRMNKNLCGIVHGVVEQLDTTTLFNQYQQFLIEKGVEFDQQLAVNQETFDNWFSQLNDVLSGDVAANLANMIITHTNNATSQKHIEVVSAIPQNLANKGLLLLIDDVDNPNNAPEIPTSIVLNNRIDNTLQELQLKADISQVNNLENSKADKVYVNGLIGGISSASPRDVFYSISALQSAFPNGESGTYLVFDASFTDGAHAFIYSESESIWKDVGVYQANAIAENSVKIEDTTFIRPGKNLFDKSTVIPNSRIGTAGQVQTLNGYNVQFVRVEAGQTYTFAYARHYAQYDRSRVFIPGTFVDNGNASTPPVLTVTPSIDGYVGVTVANQQLNNFQFEKGPNRTQYEDFKYLIPDVTFEFEQLEGISNLMIRSEQITDPENLVIKKSQIIDDLPPEPEPIQPQKNMTVNKSGNTFLITSEFGNKTLVTEFRTNSSKNGAFNFESVKLDGVVIHANTDDITPLRIWQSGMAIGANHGYTNVLSLTVNNHNKTNADLGSLWTDGITQYTLLKIDGNILYLGCPYAVNDGITISSLVNPTSNLSHVSGATNTSSISIATINTSTALTQLFPSINNRQIEITIDGQLIADDGEYIGDRLNVIEKYNIMEYKSLLDYAQANIGRTYANDSIDGLLEYTVNYSFKNSYECLISATVKPLKKAQMGSTGVLQSIIMNVSGHRINRYLPNVNSKNGINFGAGVDMTNYSTTLRFLASDLINNKIPNRFVDWAINNSTNQKLIGFTMGYIPDKSSSKDSERLSNLSSGFAWDMRNSKKSYPIARQAEILNVGDYRSYQAYRKYLTPIEPTNINIVEDAQNTYIFIDFNNNVQGYSIKLNADLIGRVISIVDSNNFTLLNDVVDANGITFNVTSSSGYGVLKI